MAKVIETDKLGSQELDREQTMQVYNGLDSLVTIEICNKQQGHLEPVRKVYDFEMACMAPALELALHGTQVDFHCRNELIEKLRGECQQLLTNINRVTRAVWGYDINPNSQKDLPWLFYDKLQVPKIWTSEKGEYKLKFDRPTLEKLQEYLYARFFAKAILEYRDRDKKIQALRSGIHADGRLRCNYNVGATETGRWSSSKSSLGGGANDQTWTEELRQIFIPDEGYELFNVDLEQAEARAVAYLAGDERFIEACESGDLWTTVCKMVWPDLPWQGDLKQDKKVAQSPFYRHFSYRDMAKRGGHAFDYMASHYTVSKHLKIPKDLAKAFGDRYLGAFKGVVEWQKRTCRELQQHGYLTTPYFQRRRYFLSRLDDDATLREAVAYRPQSLIGDLLNFGLLRLWRKYPWIQPLKQVHDSVVGQYPEGYREEAEAAIKECLEVPVPIGDRQMVVPTEMLVGWNWGKQIPNNPAGLAEDGPPAKPSHIDVDETTATLRRTIA